MASLNKAILIGNLGRDPEVRYLPSGDAVVNLAIATTDKWKDKTTGEPKESTEWHRVNFFGKLAEVCGQYLKKGSQVYVEGKIVTRKYTDKDGVEKYATEIRGESMVMLGGRQDGAGQQSAPASSAPQKNAYAEAKGKPQPQRQVGDDFDDDIPF